MGNYDGNHLIVMDFDRVFDKTPDAVVINSGDTIIDDPSSIKKIFYDADKKHLANIASCDCGHLQGNFWNTPCPICGTMAVTNFARKLDFKYWIGIPDDLPPVLNPTVYHVLSAWMGDKVLSSIMSMDIQMPAKFSKFFGSGMKYFYENFDYIIHTLATTKLLAPINRVKTPGILKFLEMYKHCLFVRRLPILNQSLHMINQKGKVTYADESMKDVVTALVNLTCILYEKLTPSTANFADKDLYSVYANYYQYSKTIIVEKIISKRGFIRKNMLGARMHCTARMVITPIAGPHWGDQIQIPWVVAVSQNRDEITNILMRRMGYTTDQAKTLWAYAQVNYDPIIDSVFDILIKESKYGGLPIPLGRNPSIRPGAIQTLFGSVKKDITDKTASISPLVLTAPNADFDGDCLYAVFLKTLRDLENCMVMHPKFTMLNEDGMHLSNCVALPDQHLCILNAWSHDR